MHALTAGVAAYFTGVSHGSEGVDGVGGVGGMGLINFSPL